MPVLPSSFADQRTGGGTGRRFRASFSFPPAGEDEPVDTVETDVVHIKQIAQSIEPIEKRSRTGYK